MKHAISFIIALMAIMLASCGDEDLTLPSEPVNQNDLSVLREMWEIADLGHNEDYNWNFCGRPNMPGVTWEEINGELRVTGISMCFSSRVEHELTPRIGELPYLKTFRYISPSVIGEWPRELYNCPLEVLKISCHRRSNKIRGGLYPEIANLSSTLRVLAICYTDVDKTCEEIVDILEPFEKLEYVALEEDNITGRVPAKLGQKNYDIFLLGDNSITSIDWEIFNTTGSALPRLEYNQIADTMPEWVMATEKWKKKGGNLIGCDRGRGPYLPNRRRY